MGVLTEVMVVALAGAFVVLLSLASRGRATRPWNRRRAAAVERRRYPVALRRASDMAIAEARRQARPGEPAIVTVGAVLDLMVEHFDIPYASRDDAAAALRERFVERGCAVDCVTDA
ncbi:hypothetical protein AB0J38_30410 [Streptomyces sp. NPDC050095]|uniref:hypothetical protein n=1 Tax=unclassified Streptomyces TaxID=2593676 RepID=UPI003412A764